MNLTRRARHVLEENLPLEDALPTEMPVYVNSVSYLFGAAALSSLAMIVLTGITLAVFGPGWYHVSKIGHFVNSLHFWSVQAFFGAIILHFLTKFFMAAWRDGRWKTWMVGVLIFGLSVFTGLTGFLSQTNWDSQWVAVQSKDAMNALGIGAFFNTMDTGQVLTLHVVVLPSLVVLLVALHLVLVRREGPVKPLESTGDNSVVQAEDRRER
ncbi:MAG: cytochrome b N-terminal domain-containing protein [Bacteroidetes bacterium]|nr:cytochrome b N-terminal domain-containing protein [Bacteroidota bacterium]MCL5738728.1 cytochrome b N-terminal domain-containing protein [Bacteroidota bacterium]